MRPPRASDESLRNTLDALKYRSSGYVGENGLIYIIQDAQDHRVEIKEKEAAIKRMGERIERLETENRKLKDSLLTAEASRNKFYDDWRAVVNENAVLREAQYRGFYVCTTPTTEDKKNMHTTKFNVGDKLQYIPNKSLPHRNQAMTVTCILIGKNGVEYTGEGWGYIAEKDLEEYLEPVTLAEAEQLGEDTARDMRLNAIADINAFRSVARRLWFKIQKQGIAGPGK